MNTFFLYLLKSGIWIAVFWLIYWLFLRKETFFRFNRMFLFAGLPASLLLPLLQYTYRVNLVLPVSTSPVSAVSESVASVFNIDFSTVLLYFYLSGVAIVLLRNLIGIVKIRQFIRKGEVTKHDRIRLVQTALIPGSFSFFNYIFMNNSLPSTSKEQALIIEHEKVHVFQEHWLDLLVVELICALQWFNPFIYLYRKSIKENQEFMADKAVLEKGNSPVFYQAVLINNVFQSPVFELTNSFTHNKFKRISIMKTTVNRPARRWASLLVLPAIAVFLWAFAKPAYSISYVYPEEIIAVSDTIKPVTANKGVKFSQKNGGITIQQDSVQMIRGNQKPLIIVDGKKQSRNWIPDNTRTGGFIIVDGKKQGNRDFKTVKVKAEEIESLEVLKDQAAIDFYGKDGKDGVIVITTNKAYQKNRILMNNDTIKQFDPDVKVIRVEKMPNNEGSITIHSVRRGDVKPPLYIIDGIEFDSDNVLELDPKDIESIEVLKDKVAIERYGEKGKDGVVLITMK